MRHFVAARRAGVPIAATVLGVLAAGPALADVSVTPNASQQGAGEDFKFHVTNACASALSTVTMKIPDDAPIAEVYPLSTDNWAPKIVTRDISTALPTAHGLGTTQVTSAITWLAVGKTFGPGATADLPIAAAPLPELSSLDFTFTLACADGKTLPAQVVKVALSKGTPAQQQALAAAHAAHEGHSGTGDADGTDGTTGSTDGTTPDEDQFFAQTVADATRGPSIWAVGGWVLLGAAVLGGAAWLVLRGRHRAEEDDEPEDESAIPATAAAASESESESEDTADDAKEPATASSGGKWSFKG